MHPRIFWREAKRRLPLAVLSKLAVSRYVSFSSNKKLGQIYFPKTVAILCAFGERVNILPTVSPHAKADAVGMGFIEFGGGDYSLTSQ